MGDVAWQMAGALLAPHMDPQRIKRYWMEGEEQLERGRVEGPGEGGEKGGLSRGETVGVNPDGSNRLVYRVGQNVFVIFRLQFGWRGTPGW